MLFKVSYSRINPRFTAGKRIVVWNCHATCRPVPEKRPSSHLQSIQYIISIIIIIENSCSISLRFGIHLTTKITFLSSQSGHFLLPVQERVNVTENPFLSIFICRPQLLRDARAVQERRHVREHGAERVLVHVPGGVLRHQLPSRRQPVRDDPLRQRRDLLRDQAPDARGQLRQLDRGRRELNRSRRGRPGVHVRVSERLGRRQMRNK